MIFPHGDDDDQSDTLDTDRLESEIRANAALNGHNLEAACRACFATPVAERASVEQVREWLGRADLLDDEEEASAPVGFCRGCIADLRAAHGLRVRRALAAALLRDLDAGVHVEPVKIEGTDPGEYDAIVREHRNSSEASGAVPSLACKPYPCDSCRLRFSKPEALERHRAIAHEGRRPFACDACGASFAFKYQLGKHERAHVQVKEEPSE